MNSAAVYPKPVTHILHTQTHKYARTSLAQYPESYPALYFPNIAKKDLLLPSFCTFSAFRSIALFCIGIAGSRGLRNSGLATLLIGTDDMPPLNGRSLGFA